MDSSPPDSRTKVLDAALQVLRGQGYCATTVDAVCAAAGVNKGSFFHHFKSKEDMALAAVSHWNTLTSGLFAHAPFQKLADPRARVLAYIDFRKELLRGDTTDYTCLLGTLVQETHGTHPRLRAACDAGIAGHAATVARDIAAAKAVHAPDAPWDAMVLALFTQAALQGAFVLAKAQGSPRIAAQCVDHLRQHVAHLLNAPPAPAGPRGRRPRSPAARQPAPRRSPP